MCSSDLPLALKPVHAGVLRLLHAGEPFTQRALAERLGVLPSQLVALLDDLEARGLVIRAPDPSDRRSRRLVLTARGGAAHEEVERVTAELELELFAALAEGEREVLRGLLVRLAADAALTAGVHPGFRELAHTQAREE